MKQVILTIALVWFSMFAFGQTNAKIKELVAKMTLEEKVKLVVGHNYDDTTIDNTSIYNKKLAGTVGRTHGIERLGIPVLSLSDGPTGVHIATINKTTNSKNKVTGWPVGTLLASTWDTALVKKVGMAFGNEVKEYGIDVILAPALNIQRNPLGGRNFEYYSEDPVVAGNIAAAMVNGIQFNGVGTAIKHFVANNQETNRSSVNTIVSERALREIYLKSFEITIKKAHPWTVMSSYNKLNGPYTAENFDLLTNVLRKEWGFTGFVMTDWYGGKDAVAQMRAGNDLIMPGTVLRETAILKAVKDGTLDEKVLNENCEHILNIILKSPTYKRYSYSDRVNLNAHALLSRQAATDGMVLLKNERSTLPIKPQRIALFGNASYNLIASGTGSGDVQKAYTISLFEGLKNMGCTLNNDIKKQYIDFIAAEKLKQPKPNYQFQFIAPIPELLPDTAMINQQAAQADIAIITIGRNAGEGSDRKVENDFNLSSQEEGSIRAISNAFHAKKKKIVVVLNIGGVIETASWKQYADAILLAWQPGIEGGNAIADILNGKINPSGKLATTFPIAYSDVPSSNNFPGKESFSMGQNSAFPDKDRKAEVVYKEGIYVGYRYYNTFGVKTSYEFGYGLSYTQFSYGKLKLNMTGTNEHIRATITIKNTGKVAGKEVVQLYLSAPGKFLDKPNEELKSFAKTALLQPGQSQNVTFNITPADLSSYDTQSAAWIAEAGKYTLKAGSSSLNIRSTATFALPKKLVVQQLSNLLVPQINIEELKSKQRK